jgi:hypothetical protein
MERGDAEIGRKGVWGTKRCGGVGRGDMRKGTEW